MPEIVPTAAQLARELIDAADARMWAMYNSNSEASWAEETARWRAAEEAAMDGISGLRELTEEQEAANLDELDRLQLGIDP